MVAARWLGRVMCYLALLRSEETPTGYRQAKHKQGTAAGTGEQVTTTSTWEVQSSETSLLGSVRCIELQGRIAEYPQLTPPAAINK